MENPQMNHRRFYQIAGITIRVESELPIADNTFHPKFKAFEVGGPGEDTITIRHHFGRLPLKRKTLGKSVYSKAPWDIYRNADSWIYMGWYSILWHKYIYQTAVINPDQTEIRIYNKKRAVFRKGNLHSLTLFPTDQILLARILACRNGCYLHASGVVLDGNGFLFVGQSGAGKSTMAMILRDQAEILCDDRMIVRRWKEAFRIHGTWSHGDVPEVSANSAQLRAIMFLEQASENRLIPLDDKKEIARKLLLCLIKPLETGDWWEKMLTLTGYIARDVSCYNLHFDKSGRVLDLLNKL